jgi:hypothetical protein
VMGGLIYPLLWFYFKLFRESYGGEGGIRLEPIGRTCRQVPTYR